MPILAVATALAPAAGAATGAAPGIYEGKRAGLTARVTVPERGASTLRYAVRTRCGRSKGSIRLAATRSGGLRGKRSQHGGRVAARIRPAGSGLLAGALRVKATAEGSRCRARRAFTARLDAESQAAALVGHYTGQGEVRGHPVAFDVVEGGDGGLLVSGFSFATEMECWDDYDGDGEDDILVGRYEGLQGTVDPDGGFEIDHTPDEDNEVYVSGTIAADGTAAMSIEVGGFFAPDGTPLPGGPFECDSWGETYIASR